MIFWRMADAGEPRQPISELHVGELGQLTFSLALTQGAYSRSRSLHARARLCEVMHDAPQMQRRPQFAP
jgi:hypothetical protein